MAQSLFLAPPCIVLRSHALSTADSMAVTWRNAATVAAAGACAFIVFVLHRLARKLNLRLIGAASDKAVAFGAITGRVLRDPLRSLFDVRPKQILPVILRVAASVVFGIGLVTFGFSAPAVAGLTIGVGGYLVGEEFDYIVRPGDKLDILAAHYRRTRPVHRAQTLVCPQSVASQHDDYSSPVQSRHWPGPMLSWKITQDPLLLFFLNADGLFS
jgi:hypothetical protein